MNDQREVMWSLGVTGEKFALLESHVILKAFETREHHLCGRWNPLGLALSGNPPLSRAESCLSH